MSNSNATETKTPDLLLKDLRELVTAAERILNGNAPVNGAEDVATLRDRLAAAQERCADLYVGAKKKVTAGAKRTHEAIHANPYRSMAIALGAGLLFGVLLGRRGSQSVAA